MKTNLILATFIGVILLCIFIYKDANLFFNESNDRPYIIQQNNQTIGFHNGKKIYDLSIKNITQKSYKNLLFADILTNGKIYNKKNDLIISDLSAKGGRINTKLKTILATNNITATIHPTTSTQSAYVTSQQFNYNHKKKESKFFDSTSLSINTINIFSDEFTYYNDDDIILFPNGFKLRKENSNTIVGVASLDVNTAIITATKNIKSTYSKPAKKNDSSQIKELLKHETIITAKNLILNYNNEEDPFIQYSGNVNISQIDKVVIADEISLNFENDQFNASSNIEIKFESLEWAINPSHNIKNAEINKIMNNSTTIKTNFAEFMSSSNTLIFSGNVSIKQSKFKLYCNKFIYNIDEEVITAVGNVIIKKLGLEYLNTETLILDIKNEQFITSSKDKLSEIKLEI